MKPKDAFELTPDFLVPRGYKVPRWIDDYLKDTKSINSSGLICTLLIQFIKEHDPECYEKNKQYIKNDMRRKETTPIPKIKPVLVHTSM